MGISTIEPGSRVKLSTKGFAHGLWLCNMETRARRGTVLRRARDYQDCWVVRWDHKKTPETIAREFLMKETTGQTIIAFVPDADTSRRR
jgi:hypothetical protein